MKQSDIQKQLGELERRVKELEQREAAAAPYWQPVPYWVYVTNAIGTDPMLTTSTTTL